MADELAIHIDGSDIVKPDGYQFESLGIVRDGSESTSAKLAKGIRGILSYAKEGIRLWFRTKHPKYRQLCLKLAV